MSAVSTLPLDATTLPVRAEEAPEITGPAATAAGQSRPPRPWELPGYRRAPAELQGLRIRIQKRIDELRPMLIDLADQIEALDLSDATGGLTDDCAMRAASAARGLEWALESGDTQLDWVA